MNFQDWEWADLAVHHASQSCHTAFQDVKFNSVFAAPRACCACFKSLEWFVFSKQAFSDFFLFVFASTETAYYSTSEQNHWRCVHSAYIEVLTPALTVSSGVSDNVIRSIISTKYSQLSGRGIRTFWEDPLHNEWSRQWTRVVFSACST